MPVVQYLFSQKRFFRPHAVISGTARHSLPNVLTKNHTVDELLQEEETKNGQTATCEPIRPKPKQTETEHGCSNQ